MDDIDNEVGVTLPILNQMSAPQKVIGHVHFKSKEDLPEFPDFCLALGFNRKNVADYVPRVFVLIDDATYLDAVAKLNLPAQMLVEKTKQKKDEGKTN